MNSWKNLQMILLNAAIGISSGSILGCNSLGLSGSNSKCSYYEERNVQNLELFKDYQKSKGRKVDLGILFQDSLENMPLEVCKGGIIKLYITEEMGLRAMTFKGGENPEKQFVQGVLYLDGKTMNPNHFIDKRDLGFIDVLEISTFNIEKGKHKLRYEFEYSDGSRKSIENVLTIR